MKATVETITPEVAARWLESNTRNRTIKKHRVQQLAGAIRRGEWEENGESIKWNGAVLIDGQHRLAAIVASGMPITSLVVRDLPVTSQDTVDIGVRRSLADVLQLRGEPDARTLAAVLNNLFLWRTSAGLQEASVNKYPTHRQALKLLADNPGVRDGLSWGRKAREAVKAPVGLSAFMHYIFSEISREDADDFFEKFITGVGISVDDPIYLLRRFYTGDRGVLKGRSPYRVHAAYFVKAWNAYRDGEPIKRLRFKAGGKTPDRFPDPK